MTRALEFSLIPIKLNEIQYKYEHTLTRDLELSLIHMKLAVVLCNSRIQLASFL